MILHVLTAAFMLQWGAYDLSATSQSHHFNTVYSLQQDVEDNFDFPPGHFVQLMNIAAEEWESTPGQMELNYVNGRLRITPKGGGVYQMEFGGGVMITVLTDHG